MRSSRRRACPTSATDGRALALETQLRDREGAPSALPRCSSFSVHRRGSEMLVRIQTPVKHGCAYGCGLCADHEQHSCQTRIEVGDGCNLACPVCYAGSGPMRANWRTLPEIEAMFDVVVASEGEPDLVQLSGGEPTLHQQFDEIVTAARSRSIRQIPAATPACIRPRGEVSALS